MNWFSHRQTDKTFFATIFYRVVSCEWESGGVRNFKRTFIAGQKQYYNTLHCYCTVGYIIVYNVWTVDCVEDNIIKRVLTFLWLYLYKYFIYGIGTCEYTNNIHCKETKSENILIKKKRRVYYNIHVCVKYKYERNYCSSWIGGRQYR